MSRITVIFTCISVGLYTFKYMFYTFKFIHANTYSNTYPHRCIQYRHDCVNFWDENYHWLYFDSFILVILPIFFFLYFFPSFLVVFRICFLILIRIYLWHLCCLIGPSHSVWWSLFVCRFFVGLTVFSLWLFGDRWTHPQKRSMPRNSMHYSSISCL